MMHTSKSPNVVVLGMHRSGTSLITSVLADSGLSAGEAVELLKPQSDNPRGFWERTDVMELNDRILADSGASWYRPMMNGVTHDGSAYREAVSAVAQSLREPWILKDPRFVLTWPVWAEILEPVVFVYVYRNPLGVAASLERRNGVSLDYGLVLWELYNRRAIELVRGHRCVPVSYDLFSAAPDVEFRKLAEQLTDHGVELKNPSSRRFEVELNHSAPSADRIAAALTISQTALHQFCVDFTVNGACSGELGPASPDLDHRVGSFANQFDREQETREQKNSLATELAESSVRLREWQAEHAKALALIDERDGALATRAAELRAMERSLEESDKALFEEREKSRFLFNELQSSYEKLIVFSNSLAGRLNRGLTEVYKLLTLRRGSTLYDELLDRARASLQEHGRDVGALTNSRLLLLYRVIAHAISHPHSTLRNLSFERLRRVVGQFSTMGGEDLARWVEQRFPGSPATERRLLDELTEELDGLTLSFPSVALPRVSVVVPVFNQYRMTINCLRSLHDHTHGVPYEVIVGDDASSDLTTSIQERIRGIQVVRGEENRGFIRNCNAAAELARGEMIVFLNNDTAVTDGWLDAMLRTMDRDSSVGVVGPKLLFADGRLQEAGGIIWKDASGWNYGRMDSPEDYEFNYLKPVDFVSGACLMVRTSLWKDLSGFDERFVPAYYEDVDLCFSARAAGYQVLYQPAAVVYHFEGVSNGTSTGSGVKKYQVQNQKVFREKWADVLDSEHFPNGTEVFAARDRSRNRRTVVVIDHYVPFYDKDAGSRSVFQYLQLMVAMGYNVKFIGANFFPHQPYTDTLQQLGIEVLVGERAAAEFESWLKTNSDWIQTIYLNRPHVAEQFLPHIDRLTPRPNIAFWGCDLHYLRTQREYEVTSDRKIAADAENWKAREYRIFDQVDHIYYPSEAEIEEIRRHRRDLEATVLPLYIVESAEVPSYSVDGRDGLLFVGGFGHPPNLDGIKWFITGVFPRLVEKWPDLVLHIVGSNTPQELQKLHGERIRIHGFISDDELEALYAHVRVSVIPLRFGAGIKGKVVEALQHGVPTVTTPIGAEGLPDVNSVLGIAEDTESFAAEVDNALLCGPDILARVTRYQDYLDTYFSRERAEGILRRDFGSPSLTR